MSNRADAVERARERWNAGDLPGYLALYGQGIRLHGYTPEPMGKVEVEGFYRSIFAAFDSPRLIFNEMLGSQDRTAANHHPPLRGRHGD
jgi:hypothetical protein